MIEKKKKLDTFWRSYIILCAVLVLLIVALTLFFYDFIKAFETGRPEYAVNEYVASVTDEKIISMVAEFLDGKLSGYEAENAVSTEVTSAMQKYELSYVRAFSDNTDDIPKYDVYCGEKILSLTLAVTDGGKYGFDNYTVVGVSVADEWIDARKNTVSIIAPSTSELTLNGINIGDDKIVGEFVPETVSEFESGAFKMNMYEIADVFGEISADATLDGSKLPLNNPSKGVYSSVYDEVESLYTILAPEKAEVMLNGIKLTDEYVTGTAIPMDAHCFEAETDMRCRVYCVKGLRLLPTVSATLDGETLVCEENELYDVSFVYPDSYKHSYTASVPDGAILYCNGVKVGEEYSVGKSDRYPIPDSAKKYASPSEYGVKYTVSGLYNEPVFTAKYNDGTSCVGFENDGVSFFYPDAAEAEKKKLEESALIFTQLYIKYSYEGTDYTEANYNAVIEHVKNGSEAYNIMKSSYSSMIYNSNFKVDKLEVEMYDTVKYSNDCYGIKVDFDSHGKYYKYEKVSVGTYTMIWTVEESGEWLLVDFAFS